MNTLWNNDADYSVAPRINGKLVICPFYRVWRNMMNRCYSTKYQDKYPTYSGCTVDQRWHSFMAFRSWMIGQDWKGKQLDKDILFLGNKTYSHKTCLFVTGAINSLLNNNAAKRGRWPQGVYWYKPSKKYQAHIKINGKKKHLGYFNTIEAAETIYKKAKKDHIMEIALQQKDKKLRFALIRHAQNYLE